MTLARWLVCGLLTAACGNNPAVPGPEDPAGASAGAPSHRGEVGVRALKVPAPTSPNERVVFVRSGSIWMARPDGSGATQLSTRSPTGADESPALSPDGTRVAYIAGNDQDYRLVVTDLDQLVPSELTDAEFGPVGEPTWSPDGKFIAVMRGDSRDVRDLVLIPTGGGEPRILLEGADDAPELAGTPAWSPDGRSIALASDRREGRGTLIFLVDVATGKARALTQRKPGRTSPPRRGEGWGGRMTHFHDRFPSWTPSGDAVVFASNRHITSIDQRNDDELYKIDVGGSLTRLSEGKGASMDPSVSPDGKRIYFTSTRDATTSYESEVYVMSISGGTALRLTGDRKPHNHSPSAGLIRRANPDESGTL